MISSVCALRRPGRKDEAHGKQVSRAESWRYESNIYIKPSVNKVIPFHFNVGKILNVCLKLQPNIFANQQSVQMQPFSSNRRFKPAESLSSSPLMRKKPGTPLMRGADIVRTTLPTTPEPASKDVPGRSRNDTYHGNIREYSDTDYAHSAHSLSRYNKADSF